MQSQDDVRCADLDDVTKAITGWPRRWIIYALSIRDCYERELCDVLGLDKSSICKHLRTLYERELVTYCKRKSAKVFSLTDLATVDHDEYRITIAVMTREGSGTKIWFTMDDGARRGFAKLNG